jgi:hypothetical protein
VAEHGEELVLGAVRGLGLLARGARLGEQPRVVDGERRALRKLADQRAVFREISRPDSDWIAASAPSVRPRAISGTMK